MKPLTSRVFSTAPLAGGTRPPGSVRLGAGSRFPDRVAVWLVSKYARRQWLVVVVALFGVHCSGSRAADWPLVRGNEAATGVAAEPLPASFDIAWTYQAAGSAWEATASIAAGVVYVGDADGTFHAVQLATGAPVWTRKFDQTGFVAGSAVADGRVYCVDFNGMVRALDAATGEPAWEFATETALYAAPNVHQGIVLIAAESGQLFALDAITGKEKWKPFSIDQPLRCWPTVVGGRVLVAGCDGRLHAVDVNSGEAVESVDIGGPADGMPAVVGNRVYFCTAGGVFHAMTIKPLAPVWQYGHRGQGEEIHAAAVTAEAVVFGTHDKRVVALDTATGKEKWTMPLRSRAESSPIIDGNIAFFGTVRGRLHAVDMTTGASVWEEEVGGRFSASPAASNGRIVIGNEDGTLYCIGGGEQRQSRTSGAD
ncbi:MAG: serine/threonine protein kinase [Planctomycetota bacterium]|nr:MAG: serine/threonine protein kinase [Planctomycetota bacterium]